MTSRRRLGAASALAATLLLTLPGPASAVEVKSALWVTPDRDDRGVLGGGDPTSRPTVAGGFAIDPPIGTIHSITLEVRPTGPQGAEARTASGCDPGACGDGKAAVPFSWQVPSLAWNGPYEATASARMQYVGGPIECVGNPCMVSATPVRFRVAVPPSPPTGLKTAVDPATRVVTLTWARNTAPDTVGYLVKRKGPGDAEFKSVGGRVPQPASGSVSYVDRETVQTGGAYEYQVVAIRPGADGARDNPGGWLFSASSGSAAATVAPPPPGASLGGGAPVYGPGGRLEPRRPTFEEEYGPDTGYKRDLPYQGAPKPAADGEQTQTAGAGGEQAIAVGGRRSGTPDRRGLLVPIAGGALLFVLAVQLRWLSRRLA